MANLLDKFLELEEPKEIKIKDSKPPTPVTKKPPKIKNDIDIDIDDIPGYRKWCNSGETKRHYIYTKTGKVYRKSKEKMTKELETRQKEIEDVKEIMKLGRGNNLDKKALIAELKISLNQRKERLAKQKEKIENESSNTMVNI